MPYTPTPHAIACFDNRRHTGYVLANEGTKPKKFPSLLAAFDEAEKLNALPHAPGRTYHIVAYPSN